MIISYLGKQFFKIQQGELVFAFNPINKSSKLPIKPASFGADVVFVTTNHPDYNGIDTVSYGDKTPFVVDGPGEYEIKELFIKGQVSVSNIDKKEYVNTVFSFAVDGIRICFLGAISDDTISMSARETLGSADIIFVPIGGEGLISPLPAYKLAMSFDPKIIIPMDYGADMEKDALKTFVSEAGKEKIEAVSKLTIKKKDLEGKEGEVVVLSI